MGERFEQPRAPEAPPKYATPFEWSLYEYEKLAHSYHSGREAGAPPNESEADRKKRIDEWEATREHLRKERLRLKSLARLNAELEAYRNNCLGKSDTELLNERHHPAKKKLGKHLAANNEPQPSPEHVAHHIIPGKGQYLQAEVLEARLTLHEHCVGINDAINGIFLPDKKEDRNHWATPNAPVHKELHGFNYERWITVSLPDILPKKSFLNRLQMIKQQLKDGNHPPEIVEPKNPDWNPTKL